MKSGKMRAPGSAADVAKSVAEKIRTIEWVVPKIWPSQVSCLYLRGFCVYLCFDKFFVNSNIHFWSSFFLWPTSKIIVWLVWFRVIGWVLQVTSIAAASDSGGESGRSIVQQFQPTFHHQFSIQHINPVNSSGMHYFRVQTSFGCTKDFRNILQLTDLDYTWYQKLLKHRQIHLLQSRPWKVGMPLTKIKRRRMMSKTDFNHRDTQY